MAHDRHEREHKADHGRGPGAPVERFLDVFADEIDLQQGEPDPDRRERAPEACKPRNADLEAAHFFACAHAIEGVGRNSRLVAQDRGGAARRLAQIIVVGSAIFAGGAHARFKLFNRDLQIDMARGNGAPAVQASMNRRMNASGERRSSR